jgi:2-(1,2-epoxy-1,2-dihydrophenyl)acetyl-CoA isomerase
MSVQGDDSSAGASPAEPTGVSTGATVGEQRAGSIAILTLHNPGKLNALTVEMRDTLATTLGRLNADPDCRAIVLTGADGNFSAGADMGGWNETTVQQCRTRLKRGGSQLMREIVAGAKPVIAAVEGYAYGAGLALSCAADHLVADPSARFCCAFTKIAFIPDLALMYTLPRRVGFAKAKQLIALAETIDAARAERLGLVDEVTEPGRALSRALELAGRYAEGPPLAFELMKSAFARDLEAMIQAELDLQPYAWLSADHEEGKQAFHDRRKPKFTGR